MSRSRAGSRGKPSSFSLTVLRCISLLPPATDITMAFSHDEPIGPLSEPSLHVIAAEPQSSTAISARRCSLRPELSLSSDPHGPLRVPVV